jgi:branched-chain amino acid transport system substrate-binding protein
MEIVAHEHFATTDLSVAAQLARVKAANPQVLVAWSSGTSFGTVLRNISDAGITVPIFTSSANLSHVQLAQYRSFAPKLYFVAGGGAAVRNDRSKQHDAQVTFVNAFRDAGLRVEYLNTIAWDPTMIVIDALRNLGPAASPADLRSYIADLHDWTGIVGTYDFRRFPQRGVGRSAATIYEWDPQTDAIAVVPFTP